MAEYNHFVDATQYEILGGNIVQPQDVLDLVERNDGRVSVEFVHIVITLYRLVDDAH